jgi:hypothetical protein
MFKRLPEWARDHSPYEKKGAQSSGAFSGRHHMTLRSFRDDRFWRRRSARKEEAIDEDGLPALSDLSPYARQSGHRRTWIGGIGVCARAKRTCSQDTQVRRPAWRRAFCIQLFFSHVVLSSPNRLSARAFRITKIHAGIAAKQRVVRPSVLLPRPLQWRMFPLAIHRLFLRPSESS